MGIAWVGRERDGYAGPWVFYPSHARKRALGEAETGPNHTPETVPKTAPEEKERDA